jgi:hypothetical protein
MHITFEDEDAKQKAIDTQWLFSLNTVSSTNKTNCHDIPEILLKVTLNTINQAHRQFYEP